MVTISSMALSTAVQIIDIAYRLREAFVFCPLMNLMKVVGVMLFAS
jgi:hypothetical protein